MVRRRSSEDAGESEHKPFLGGHMTIAILIIVFIVLLAALMFTRRSRRRV
jgi:hypothetical protein